MAGTLVGLVLRHGPDDHNARSVLVVIAEDLYGPLRSSILDNVTIAERCRLSSASVKRGLRVLVEEQWISRLPGRHTGVASTYRLRLEAFPADAVEDVLHRGSHRPPLPDEEIETGGHTDPLSTKEGVTQSREGVTQTPLAVSVSPSVPDEVDEPMPGVLVEVRNGGTDEAISTVLRDVPDTIQIRDVDGLRRVLDDACANGWTPESLRSELAARRHDYSRIGGGAITASLRSIASTPRVAPVVDEGPICVECSKAESACRRIPEHVSGHEFRPIDSTAVVDLAFLEAKEADSVGADKRKTGRGEVDPDWISKFKARTG